MQGLYTYFVTSMWLAVRELLHHGHRSFLTMLGILIGTACVVVIASVGEGLNEYFEAQLVTQSTADLVFVMPDTALRAGQTSLVMEVPFKQRDLQAVRGSEFVTSAYGGNMEADALVKHGWRTQKVMLMAAAGEFMPVNNMAIEEGRLFSLAEERNAAKVAVVGPKVVEQLYEPDEPVLGSSLLIKGVRFKVIGVLEERSAVQNGQEVNLGVFIPLETGQHRVWGSHDMLWLIAKVRSRDELEAAKEDIAARLRQTRSIRSGADDDFLVTTLEEWARFASDFVRSLTAVFALIAVLALLVGGISVMNVMLLSVRMRTQEIGLRKAVGATSGHIAWQFLIEALTLTSIGGVAGLGIGWLASFALMRLVREHWDVYWTPDVSAVWVAAVLLTSLVVGLSFGVFPAWKASRLDPIAAMRKE